MSFEPAPLFLQSCPGAELFCLGGERACPPEDVGGIPGYFEFCKAVKDPGHREHKSYIEWYAGNYDSENFNAQITNWELMKYLRWSRDRYKSWYEFE
ncbi:MAG: plasmid pRiA4b ORF-3 family protein [Desulfobacteraceae bacterium]|nr:plasmid pRiA4b ORF-3 family protein [Desulfobacteraceae bacterium]